MSRRSSDACAPVFTTRQRSKTRTSAGGLAGGSIQLDPVTETDDDEPAPFPIDGAMTWVRHNVFGQNLTVPGPFGPHPRRYFDYTASGLPFRPIEDQLAKQVLPYMSNTHSSSSYASEIITAFVEQAHQKVRRALRGTDDDVVVFTGSGATGAVNKLITAMGLRVGGSLADHLDWTQHIPVEKRPIVLLTRMEHHSNDLPWRESICDIEYIGYDEQGRANWRDVDRILMSPEYRDRPLKIGTFTAASNVTGVLNDTKQLAAAMHAHGGLAFFDFAAAAPYIDVDLHPEDKPAYQKDAVFISVHKFTGGPQSPGLLVANKAVFAGRTPAEPGGGTVLYTSPWEYRYLDDVQQREQSGTPAIVSVIRAGLAFDLKTELGTARLQTFEEHCVTRVSLAWRNHPKVRILGPDPLTVPRLGILSLILDHGDLHHNLAVRLLNDLYGIQVRGGCMCAGTYGHDLLDIGKAQSKSIREMLDEGNIAAKPGWIRVSFGPAVSPDDLEILVEAIPHIAERWRDYAKDYLLDEETAEWRHKHDVPPNGELQFRLPEALALTAKR
jgi:selenocysteine lyase/cysteine desulfurase